MPAQAMAKPAQMMAGSSRGNGRSALAMVDPVQVMACLAQATANPAQAKEEQAEAVQPVACGTRHCRQMMPQPMIAAKYAIRPTEAAVVTVATAKAEGTAEPLKLLIKVTARAARTTEAKAAGMC
jgi:hypothetical protein